MSERVPTAALQEIMKALGLSEAGCRKRHREHGMPIHSAQAAIEWSELRGKGKRTLKTLPGDGSPRGTFKNSPKLVEPLDEPEEVKSNPTDQPPDVDLTNVEEIRKSVKWAKSLESIAARQLHAAVSHTSPDISSIEKAQRSLSQAQRHKNYMINALADLERKDGVTLTLDEATDVYGPPIRAFIKLLDVMATVVAPRCVSVDKAETAIRDYIIRAKKSIKSLITDE